MSYIWQKKSVDAWLENFSPSDAPHARRLLESVRLISETEFRSSFAELIDMAVSGASGPIAAFAAQSIPDEAFTQSTDLRAPQIGSELLVQNVLNKFENKGSFLVTPDIETMRRSRVREIAVFTDHIGSGREVAGFIDYLYANRTIASWTSGHFVRFSVYAYSVSSRGRWALSHHPRSPKLTYMYSGLDFKSAGWRDDTEKEIRRICREYSDAPALAYGYGDAENLVIFQHTTPNGLPRIILQKAAKDGGHWNSLAPRGRSIGIRAIDWLRVSLRRPYFDAEQYLARLSRNGYGHKLAAYQRRALRQDVSHLDPLITQLLVAIGSGVREPDQLAVAIDTTHQRLNTLLELAISLNYLSLDRRLTATGRAHMTGVTRRLPRDQHRAIQQGIAYYPRQLR